MHQHKITILKELLIAIPLLLYLSTPSKKDLIFKIKVYT